MSKKSEKIFQDILAFAVVVLMIIGCGLVKYKITEKRIEKLYKIENPTMNMVFLEMLR